MRKMTITIIIRLLLCGERMREKSQPSVILEKQVYRERDDVVMQVMEITIRIYRGSESQIAFEICYFFL